MGSVGGITCPELALAVGFVGRILMMSKRSTKPKKKKPDTRGDSFDALCRTSEIPVRADFNTENAYKRARKRAGLA